MPEGLFSYSYICLFHAMEMLATAGKHCLWISTAHIKAQYSDAHLRSQHFSGKMADVIIWESQMIKDQATQHT